MEINGLAQMSRPTKTNAVYADASLRRSFAGMVQQFFKNGESLTADSVSQIQLSDEEKANLMDLLEFLQAEDIFELEGGKELLDEILSGSSLDWLSLIKQLLGLDQKTSLKDWLMALDGGKQLSNMDDCGFSLQKSKESFLTGDDLDTLMVYLLNLLSLQEDEFTKAMSGDAKELLKAVKWYDLLWGSELSGKQGQLTELMNQLKKKLEMLMENGDNLAAVSTEKQSERWNYLQKTFASLLTEMEGKQAVSSEMTGRQENSDSNLTKSDSLNGFWQFQRMSKAEQLTLTLGQSGKGISTEQLIRQFENILARSRYTNVAGTQKLFVRLYPEHLGSLRIELIQRDAGIVAKILTTTQAAKDMLESQLHGLKQAFSLQNIQVDRIEISQQMAQQERYFKDGQQQQGQQQQQQQQNRGSEEFDNGQDFTFSLENALLNMEA